MQAYGWTGLLAISMLIISTSAWGDKEGKVADLVKDAGDGRSGDQDRR